jgi:hypothetical protein
MFAGMGASYTWLAESRYDSALRTVPAGGLRGLAIGALAGAFVAPLIIEAQKAKKAREALKAQKGAS